MRKHFNIWKTLNIKIMFYIYILILCLAYFLFSADVVVLFPVPVGLKLYESSFCFRLAEFLEISRICRIEMIQLRMDPSDISLRLRCLKRYKPPTGFNTEMWRNGCLFAERIRDNCKQLTAPDSDRTRSHYRLTNVVGMTQIPNLKNM